MASMKEIAIREYLSKIDFNRDDWKLSQIQIILEQNLGENWKIVLVITVLFIFGLIVLIIYSITPVIPLTDTPTIMEDIDLRDQLRVGLIVSLLAIIFFCIWFTIQPSSDDNKIYGVSPYPTDKPYIPPNNTKCGLIPTHDENGNCSMCADKNGINDYSSVTIPKGKQVYYLGSPLEPGKSYCLPKFKDVTNMMNGCGTNTGKIVWTGDQGDGQGWECQCLYSDLYYDTKYCMTQVSCVDGKFLDDNGKTFDDPQYIGTGITPYSKKKDGTAMFKCVPTDNSNIVYSEDPYNYHHDLCYSGTKSDPSTGYFDQKTKECSCLNGKTVKGNITGYCYPIEDNCQPNPHNGKCTYGIKPYTESGIGIILNIGGVLYFPIIVTVDSTKTIYLLNYQSCNDGACFPISIDGIVDILPTVLKESFDSYDKIDWKDLSQQDQNLFRIALKSDYVKGDVATLNTALKTFKGVVRNCNSFYSHSDTVNVNCDGIGGSMLNASGSHFNILCNNNNSCGSNGTCREDITTNTGWTCDCKTNYQFKGTTCIDCVGNGGEIDLDSSETCENTTKTISQVKCCSGKATITGTSHIMPGNNGYEIVCTENCT